MASVLEGVDDEVVFTFLFLVISCVIVAAVYLRSRRNHSRSVANSETATTTDADHSTPGFGTQTNSNTVREDNGVRSDNHNAALNPDSDGPGTSNKTMQSSRDSPSTSFASEGVRRRFGAQTNDSNLSSAQNTVGTMAATTTSGSDGTDAASCGGLSHANKSNDLMSTANEKLSSYTYNSFGTSASHSTTSSHGTNTGTSTTSLHGTDTGPNTTSSHGGTDTGPSTTSSHGTSTDPGRMSAIRVKYLETERSFTVDVFMKVGELKRLCFPTEVNQGRTVRLIYSGRLLINDEATLSYYGVGNNSVIHAQISNVSQPGQSQEGQQQIDDSDIDIGQIFLPLLTIILCGCWYGLISYRNMFSTMSAAILVVLTGAYTIVVYAMIG